MLDPEIRLPGFSNPWGFPTFSGGSGFSGVSGYSGLSGVSGYSGASGFSGNSGISGYSGASGFSGKSGFSGTNSTSGFSGKSGFSGLSGFSGRSGFSGAGTSGFSGVSGTSGSSGFSGLSGYSGKSGFSGANASDIRIKKNIRPFDKGMDVLRRIQPVTYEWNGLWGRPEDGKTMVGVIGQEIESVAPWAVVRATDRIQPGGPVTEILQVHPAPLVFLLVNAVRDLSRQIKDLETGGGS